MRKLRITRGTKFVKLPDGTRSPLPCRITSDTTEYSPDEWEFIKAFAAAQTAKGARLTAAEMLRVAIRLGWRKPFAPGEVRDKAGAVEASRN